MSRETAKSALVHYFKHALNFKLEGDHRVEIEGIIDDIFDEISFVDDAFHNFKEWVEEEITRLETRMNKHEG